MLLKRQQQDDHNLRRGHLHMADRTQVMRALPSDRICLASQQFWDRIKSASGIASFAACWCSWSARSNINRYK